MADEIQRESGYSIRLTRQGSLGDVVKSLADTLLSLAPHSSTPGLQSAGSQPGYLVTKAPNEVQLSPEGGNSRDVHSLNPNNRGVPVKPDKQDKRNKPLTFRP